MDNNTLKMPEDICRIFIYESQLNQQEDIFHIIDTVLGKTSPNHIILDCKEIQRINSSGIGKLVYLKRYLSDEKKVSSELVNINPQILKTLKSVKVDQLLGIYN